MDLRWTSMGGLLLDGTGDLASTSSNQEELESMAQTRLKAAINSWKLYTNIGANLVAFEGYPLGVNTNTVLAIQRSVTASLTNQFLPAGSFNVQTVVYGNEVQVLVYLGQSIIASTTITV
jgi:hypothetical protein